MNTVPILPNPPADGLSAWMDGELHGPENEQVLAQLLSSPQQQAQWHAYQVVGDVLRSDELAGAGGDLQFWARLEARLQQEPGFPKNASEALPQPVARPTDTVSANAAVFRWRAIAGVACTVLLAVLAAVAWVPQAPTAMVAAGPLPVRGNAPEAVLTADVVTADGMIRDPRLDQLLSAHQQLGGHSALQMPSGFLRNATYEGAGR